MTIDLDKLELLARAATPGPWEHGMGSTVTASTKVVAYELDAADADFVAACREAVPALVQRLRHGSSEVERLAENARRFDSDWMAIRAELAETKERLRAAESVGERCQVCGLTVPGKIPDGWAGTHERCHRIEAIVCALAAFDPSDSCEMCGARRYKDEPHEADCLITRAVEATKP